jgi:hypothetical protein
MYGTALPQKLSAKLLKDIVDAVQNLAEATSILSIISGMLLILFERNRILDLLGFSENADVDSERM